MAFIEGRPEGSFGQSLGAAAGEAFGGGLNRLIEKKISDLQERQGIDKRKSTYSKAGLPDWLAELPEDKQNLFLKEFDFLPPEAQQQVVQALGNIGTEEPQQNQPNQADQNIPSQEQPSQQRPAVRDIATPLTKGLQEAGYELPTALKRKPSKPLEISIPGLNNIMKAGEGFQKEPGQAAASQSFPSLGHGTKGQPGSFESGQIQKAEQPRQFIRKETRKAELALPIAQQKAQAAQENITRKEQIAEQNAAQKETLPYYNEVLSQEKAAKKTDADTNRMLQLIKEGNLPNPAFYKILKDIEDNITPTIGIVTGGALGAGLGLLGGPASPVTVPVAGAVAGAIGAGLGAIVQPIASLLRFAQKKLSPGTEEFEKLSASFISGAKSIFGARITDQDLKAFMNTVPTLANTEQGKKDIIRNIQLTNKATEVKAKNMKKIIKENGGKRPLDLQEQVEERSAEELDKLAKQFVYPK